MLNVNMLWSNVCILSVQEEKFLAQARETLRASGIELDIAYYGLAKPETLTQRIRRGGFDADIMVSTDLDVFEEPELFGLFKDALMPMADLLPVKAAFKGTSLCANPLLLPIHFVPLILVVNRALWGADRPLPKGFADAADAPKAFGGSGNSAGKGLRKQLRQLYGQGFEERFCAAAQVFEMPVQAFNAVRTGCVPVAVTPTVFALRADGEEMIPVYPEEGAASVPCFAAARDSLPADAVKQILETIFTYDVNAFYTDSGHIQSCLANAPDFRPARENGYRFLYCPGA